MPFTRDNTIQKRVMAVVKARIANAQTEYDNGCVDLDEKFEEHVRVHAAERDNGKNALADDLVEKIIGRAI